MTFHRVIRALACLLGAAGVAAAAGAAHDGGDTRLAAAAQMLLVHAAAALALGAMPASRFLLLAAAGIEVGATLFAADMASRVFTDHALFPMAAPSGGIILIVSWLAASATLALRRD